LEWIWPIRIGRNIKGRTSSFFAVVLFASTLLIVRIGIPYLRHIEKKDEQKENNGKLNKPNKTTAKKTRLLLKFIFSVN
jgi:hypothetical protein